MGLELHDASLRADFHSDSQPRSPVRTWTETSVCLRGVVGYHVVFTYNFLLIAQKWPGNAILPGVQCELLTLGYSGPAHYA